MVFQRCDGCERRRSYLDRGERYDCRTEKFCEIADIRLSELASIEVGRPLTLEEHKRLAAAMRDGHQRAIRELGKLTMPDSGEDFVELVLKLHHFIFAETKLSFAGRLRQAHEPGVSYGYGKHRRDGVDAGRIEPGLHKLFDNVFANLPYEALDRRRLARVCARFLEEFFSIHPFHDGNGRVARLVLRLVALRTNGFFFDRFPDHNEPRKKYERALEFAHAQVSKREYSHLNGRDPYGLLADWVESYLRQRPATQELWEEIWEPTEEPSWAGNGPIPSDAPPYGSTPPGHDDPD